MLFLGSFRVMKRRQLFWIALCVLELAGNAAGNPTGTPAPTVTDMAEEGNTSGATTRTIGATGATGTASSAKPTPDTAAAAGSLTGVPSSTGSSGEQMSPQTSQAPTVELGTSLETQNMSQSVPTTKSPETQPSEAAEASGSTVDMKSSPATTEHPPVSAATLPPHTARDSPKPSPLPITCHNVKEVSDTGAICLQLNESTTCKHFLERKGSDLWRAVCQENAHPVPSPCQVKLAKSEVDHHCLLLILSGEKDPAPHMLKESHWEKFGIKSLKWDSVRNHQDFSQKTLIALVTSGLLLAFLGLAGYFLMRRRSWSPAGERLAEDPYYTENGSQGNTMLMTPSQEQPEPQEKPNLNGGTQENGTGQASSKNGHSARQHSPADTEM
ncbi:hematopoietic progenitor cell antigen CD34 [Pipra filicauda]|uniref:Hematopoietic progenitor cell antigen CD34 n=1 Tax=Pipra filicauda TaxID=649802 RepID=A0A6J2GE82_9PASS|nr:hematopoietic progenitor cell antigen CD34 [Pipra filicauda]